MVNFTKSDGNVDGNVSIIERLDGIIDHIDEISDLCGGLFAVLWINRLFLTGLLVESGDFEGIFFHCL